MWLAFVTGIVIPLDGTALYNRFVTGERSKQRRKWTLLWPWPSDSQPWIGCLNLAGCQHCGLYNYSQIESESLLHNTFTPLTFSEVILLHENSLSSDASVQLPALRQDISWSPLDFKLLRTIIFLCNAFHFMPSWASITLAQIFQALSQNVPINLIQLFSIWKLCVFIGRDKGFLSVLQRIICTIQTWYY